MSFFDIVQAFLPLIIIAALLYAVLFVIKKYGLKRVVKTTIPGIKIISTQLIMPKKYISVIKIHDHYLVVGITEGSMNVLKELNSESFPEEEDEQKDSFLSILKKNIQLR